MNTNKSNLLEQLNDWLNSPEGKKEIELDILHHKLIREQYKRFNEKLHSVSKEERNAFFEKVKNKYDSEEYKDRWYNQGFEPENFLYDYIYEYGKEFGKEVPDNLEIDFLVDSYIIDNTWKVELFCGQGSFISFMKL